MTENNYETELAEYNQIYTILIGEFANTELAGGIPELIMNYLEPYIVYSDPYADDCKIAQMYARKLKSSLPTPAVCRVLEFLMPRRMMTIPIPSTITTTAIISNFNFDSKDLIDNAKPNFPHIESIGNIYGWKIADGCPDPRDKKKKSNQGRPTKRSNKNLFGSAQTTFRVRTKYRKTSKIFAVKVFRAAVLYCLECDGVLYTDKIQKNMISTAKAKICEMNPLFSLTEVKYKIDGAKQWKQENVIIETLGGLFVDCRDTKDANQIVLNEIKRALNRPDIKINKFYASMRNYSKFCIVKNMCVDLVAAVAVFKEYDEIDVKYDVNFKPPIILSIKVDGHTSKKKCVSVKIFPSGKIAIASVVLYKHLYDVYRFINYILIKHHDKILYTKKSDHEYDSDYYYDKCGVPVPDISFRT